MTAVQSSLAVPRWRFLLLLVGLVAMPGLLLFKVAALQVLPSEQRGAEFLQDQGERRTLREERVPAYRGEISDRNGAPLAVSTPVSTLLGNMVAADGRWSSKQVAALAELIDEPVAKLQRRLEANKKNQHLYIARQLPLQVAEQAMALQLPGLREQREYKRYYPAGEVAAQLVGLTDIDDRGIEGLEKSYQQVLAGQHGLVQVVKDRSGRTIKSVAQLKEPKMGESLRLTIDLRVQYAAYRALKQAVKEHQAEGGSVVVLDVQTGEVLAMANQPSFNPNDRTGLNLAAVRNRAAQDMLEPGSTVKPLALLAALESGQFTLDSQIDTHPGSLKVDYKTFTDHSNYGVLDLAGVLIKSSNVGTTKIALELAPEQIRDLYQRFGFGRPVGLGLPGETAGNLPAHRRWDDVTRANYAFGYGLQVSALQLANAYLSLANDGRERPLSLVKPLLGFESQQVADPQASGQIRKMLAGVVEEGGTGTRGQLDGYSSAGKTGTVHKASAAGGYHSDRYMSVFAGMAPVEKPRVVTVVVVDDPRARGYFGGEAAAPVFADVTSTALRLMQVTPDAIDKPERLAGGAL